MTNINFTWIVNRDHHCRIGPILVGWVDGAVKEYRAWLGASRQHSELIGFYDSWQKARAAVEEKATTIILDAME